MIDIVGYHRPTTLEEAERLLESDDRIPLGGGTSITEFGAVEVVDLQALGLEGTSVAGNRLSFGAMVRLGDLTDDDRVPLLAEMARDELSSLLRNQATIGGTVAGRDRESLVLAGLLVHAAVVEVHDEGSIPLPDFLAAPTGGLITAVSVELGGSSTSAATRRTPSDRPIVAAVGRATGSGLTVAVTGVSEVPVVVDPARPLDGLAPEADFRGTAEYRLHLAGLLTARVARELAR